MSDAGAAVLLVGRLIFAFNFVAIAGVFHITQGQMAIGYARQMNFPLATLGGWPAGVWLIAGGLSVALGIWGDVGSLMIAVFVILAGPASTATGRSRTRSRSPRNSCCSGET